MRVSTFTSWAQGLTEFQVLNLTTLAIAQAVIDEIWAMDVPQRMVNGGRWSPYLATNSLVLAYNFTDIGTNVRKVIGVWRPALSEATAVQDYNYPQYSDFYQADMRRRVYEADIHIDNELRALTFKESPGSTTDVWAVDYFTSAPILTDDSDIPLISESWVPRLFLPGYLSYLERDKAGQKGPNRSEFESQLKEYENVLRHNEDLSYYNTTQGFIPKSVVQPI